MAGVKGRSGGKRDGSGRRKGTPNKMTRELKEMILEALDNKGGVKYLERAADENMSAFLTLVGKVLPMTVQGDAQNPLTFTITTGVPRADDN